MRTIPKEWLEFLREHFPVGSRIKIRETVGPHPPMEADEVGTLDQIDDGGHFLVDLKGGARLVLVLGEDSFSVLPPELTQLKLYMPLTADFYPRNEWGDIDETGEEWDGRALLDYEAQILSALIREGMPEEAERGLMHWYDKTDSLDVKVRSAVFTVEAREGRLWGVAECRVPHPGGAGGSEILPGRPSRRRMGRGLRAAGDRGGRRGALCPSVAAGQLEHPDRAGAVRA